MNSTNVLKSEQEHLEQIVLLIETLISELKEEERRKRLDPSLPGNQLAKKRINQYENALQDLYFGRVDIVDGNEKETWYFGENAVSKDDTDNIIYDYRSPMGDTFHAFFGGDGKITFDTPGGKHTVTVLLKRELTIKERQVKNYNDTYSNQFAKFNKQEGSVNYPEIDTTYSDHYLSDLLKNSTSTHGIKKIIATIQKEQNEVIRLGINQPILIQGVAGSGKSTVTLNRISFLLYRYKDTLKPEKILILAPNKMFLSYIKGVVPSLDISDVEKQTFVSLAQKMLPNLKKVIEPYQKLSSIVNGEITFEDIHVISSFKGSLKFKDIIDKYIHHLESTITNTILEFKFWDKFVKKHPTFSIEMIQESLNSFSNLPLERRRREVLNHIKKWKDEYLSKKINEFDKEFENTISKWVDILPPDSPLRKSTFISLEKVHLFKKEEITNEVNNEWKEYQKKWRSLTSIDIYKTILQPEIISNLVTNLEPILIKELTSYLNSKEIHYEDLAPIMYIESKINTVVWNYDYIIIDEAQDLSPFQFFILKNITKSMTILGDITQSIFSFAGIRTWEEVTSTLWEKEQIKKCMMEISYRSTHEIMETANQVIKSANLPYCQIKPFNRHGEQVCFDNIRDEQDLLEKIYTAIQKDLLKGLKKIAIIHKDEKRSKALFTLLKQQGFSSIQIVLELNQPIIENIVIIPSYLVKGFEFDSVIIPNANSDNYKNNELDAKLLFVSLTRAHHKLHVFYHKTISPLLSSCIKESKQKKPIELSIL